MNRIINFNDILIKHLKNEKFINSEKELKNNFLTFHLYFTNNWKIEITLGRFGGSFKLINKKIEIASFQSNQISHTIGLIENMTGERLI